MEQFPYLTERKPEGWATETEAHQATLRAFFRQVSEDAGNGTKPYDAINDLHISGSNIEVLRNMRAGEGNILRVDVLYESNAPTQIHVVFDSEGHGHNLDVYLKNKALKD